MPINLSVYQVTFRLLEPLLGTVPKNKDVYTRYIAGKTDANGNLLIPDPKMIEEEAATVPEDIEKGGWTGFHEDERGIFLYNYAILGFLKEAGNTLRAQIGVANLRSKIDQFVFVEPRRIYLGKDRPDGWLERPFRGLTMQGPRVTVVRSDYVDAGTEFSCRLLLLRGQVASKGGAKDEITEEVLRTLLDYGKFKGLGQFRNGSYGRFEYELTPIESADKATA